ncbi:MAG: tyrosine--tRNA ligase [Candidatus Peribacteraceae bacterium]|nr:tyrosine--tRNA ligase [Candidatus Peribacteraceae bacterium]
MPANQELLTRAVETVVPRELAEEKLKSGKKLRLYLGIDPTGSKLHLGHSVPLRKLKAFSDAGHHVVFLIGSFTAMIGDPTGRDAMREPLTKEQVRKNFETYKEQASKILDFSAIELRYNHEWLENMSFAEIMRLSSHFTVQQMMQRDMFKERMKWKVVCAHCKELSDSPIQFQGTEDAQDAVIDISDIQCSHCGKMTPVTKETIIPPPNPISPNEFMYPLMQGYDSVMLDVDFEIGGNDQLFNMLCGRKLQKVYGKREKCVLTTRLIEGTDGRKMSKTYDNCIWLEDAANDMYGKVLRVRDDLIVTYMECATEMPMDDVKEAEQALKKGANPKELKMRLAREIVTLYHGADAAISAEREFQNVFSQGGVPEDMPDVKAEKGSLLLDVIVKNKLAPSKSETRRLIEQGAVSLNEEKITAVDAAAKEGILKVGKRKFVRLQIR